MLIWRLSTARYATVFDGGYGLFNNGRWNSKGNRITYCATSPALCVLEKLVHIEDPSLLPPLKMITYELPDSISVKQTALASLHADWPRRMALTQAIGDGWLKATTSVALSVPSAVLPVTDSPDLNILINHAHLNVAKITIRSIEEFTLDARLLL